ncbi:MAG: substrate-binding domain-containing protein, partial [Actinomycetia bacterium]|nr:substrate-binding domain-containing protein [Actinomycetes bacterium]
MHTKLWKRRAWLGLASAALALALTSCGSDDDSADDGDGDGGGGGEVAVSLITKDSTNPFFVAMQEGAKEPADELGVDLTIGSGSAEGDDQGQIELIEAAIAQGQDGSLITPMSVNVNDAIQKARDAGLYVIALDTPTD